MLSIRFNTLALDSFLTPNIIYNFIGFGRAIYEPHDLSYIIKLYLYENTLSINAQKH